MPYYQGDFYQGDFYQGDPFFGALLSRIGKAGLGLVKGAIGLGSGGKLAKAAPAAAGVAGVLSGAARTTISRVGGVVAKHPVLSAAGAAGTIGVLGGMGAGRAMAPAVGARMRGMHLNKHGRMVRNRHMNVCNPRALRRAVRRAHGFTRLAMRTIHLIHPHKKVKFGGFKKRRKK